MKYLLIINRIFIGLIIISFLSSCETSQQVDDSLIFRYNESKGISTLDPAFAKSQTLIWPISQLFNGLVQMTPDNQIAPCIAHSWEIKEQGLEYRFFLRQDVLFHQSALFKDSLRKVKASDFVYSLQRLFDPKTASPGAWVMNYLQKDTLNKGLLALNDSTLIIRLKQPFPGFLGILSMAYCSVVPQEVVEHYGKSFRNHPIGTGAFYMKRWREGEKLVLRRNPNYFETDKQGQPLPYLEAVSIRFIADKQSEFLEFLNGKIDFISGVHNSYKDELLNAQGELTPKYKGKIKILKSPYLNTEYLGFLYHSKTIDKNLRKAINFGFDRGAMLRYLRNNIGVPAYSGFVPPSICKYEKRAGLYQYNKDSAWHYLKQSDYYKNKSKITLATTGDYVDLCEYIQHQLQEIGIDLQVEISSGATFRDQVATGKLPFFRGSWIADYPDPENYLSLFYSPNFTPMGPNYTHFKNITYDQKYEKALLSDNDEERHQLYAEMEEILMEECPIVPLFYDEIIRFYNPQIQNFETNAMNLLFLKQLKKKKVN